jgi:hypothetical protein
MARAARLVFPELEARAVAAKLRAAPLRRWPAEARELALSYRGVAELGLLDLRDPGPLVFYVGRALGRRMGLLSV